MSVTSILDIARNALSASQLSLQTTSHNIANVNTVGYSRQEAVQTETRPVPTAQGFIGTGVTVTGIRRYYDKYLEEMLAKKNTSFAEQQVYSKYLSRIEGVFNEDNSHLSDKITSFFNSWQELTLDPTSLAAKQAIVASGENMSTVINDMHGELRNLQIELNNNVGSEVNDINRITSSIASLNKLIFESSASGAEANDYLDQRTGLIKELSGKIGVTTVTDEYNRVTVLTSGGRSLVDGGLSWQLSTISDPETGLSGVGWSGGSSAVYDITSQLRSGSLYASINTRDTKIGQFITSLDDLAKGIIENVNYFHRLGNGGEPDKGTGVPFFQPTTGNFAQSIRISDQVKANVQKVAASSDLSNPTDNDVALKIASLIEERLINGSSVQSKTFSSTTTALNLEGNLLLDGVRIGILPSDTLSSLATKLSVGGVTASVVSEGDYYKLNLSSDTAGQGISMLSVGRLESDSFTTKAVAGAAGLQGDLSIQGHTISVSATDNLTTIAGKINGAVPSSASIDAGGRLVLSGIKASDDISLLNSSMSSDAILQDLGIIGSTFTGHVAATVSTIGEVTKGANDLAQYQEDTMKLMTQQRESVSGVSLDEEMGNLIKFQHAYQAAARLFTVADELMKNLLQSVGA